MNGAERREAYRAKYAVAASFLSQLIERTGISKSEAARRVGVHHTMVQNMCRGDVPFPRQLTDDLRGVLQLSLAEGDALLLLAGHTPPSWETLTQDEWRFAAELFILAERRDGSLQKLAESLRNPGTPTNLDF